MTFWAIFCTFTLLITQKIKILTRWKTPGDIIILHLCTTSDDHMVDDSWDMERDAQNFLWFQSIFCLFTPWTTWKIKISKKRKKHWKISSFYTCVPQMMIYNDMIYDMICHMIYDSWDMKGERHIFGHFGPFFALIPPKQPRKSTFWENEKKAWRYYHFMLLYHK